MKKSEAKKLISPAAIKAAETLVCAMAWASEVKPVVDGYSEAILKEIGGMDERNADLARRYPNGVYVPELVATREQSYLLSQFNFDIYYHSCQRAIEKLGFTVPEGSCPLLCAESDVIKARWSLLKEMENITGIEAKKIPCNKMEEASDVALKAIVTLKLLRSTSVLIREFADNNPYYRGILPKAKAKK